MTVQRAKLMRPDHVRFEHDPSTDLSIDAFVHWKRACDEVGNDELDEMVAYCERRDPSKYDFSKVGALGTRRRLALNMKYANHVDLC